MNEPEPVFAKYPLLGMAVVFDETFAYGPVYAVGCTLPSANVMLPVTFGLARVLFVRVCVPANVTTVTMEAVPLSFLKNRLPSYVLSANSPSARSLVVGFLPDTALRLRTTVFAIITYSM